MNGTSKVRPRWLSWLYRPTVALLGLYDRWLRLGCRSFIQTASEKFERRLTRGERFRQALHRTMCRICRDQERRMEQLRALVHDLGREQAESPAVRLSPEATARIRRAMEAAQRQSPPDGEGGGTG